MPASESGSEAFDKLKAILKEHAPQLTVRNDEPRFYLLRSHLNPRRKKGDQFAAVVVDGNLVRYYLTALFPFHDLRQQISPELNKHVVNGTCFDFQLNGSDLTDDLVTELAGLTKNCLDRMLPQPRA